MLLLYRAVNEAIRGRHWNVTYLIALLLGTSERTRSNNDNVVMYTKIAIVEMYCKKFERVVVSEPFHAYFSSCPLLCFSRGRRIAIEMFEQTIFEAFVKATTCSEIRCSLFSACPTG